jgi:hypothetical protein
LICVPAFVGARAWRRHLAPDWSPALALLAELVGAISGVVVLGELLGTFGQFRRAALVAASVVLGLGSAWWCRHDIGGSQSTASSARRPVTDVIIAATPTALVCSQWSTWVARTVSFGVGNGGGGGDGDGLWYHMPFAAAFVQSGWTSRLQYLNGDALITYYPANASMLHAVAILAMGSDVLSVFVNLALVLVALLAGWCIGERAGVGSASLAGVAVALTIPIVVVIEAGTAKDDMLGIVGLLASIAFVVHSGARDGTEAATSIFGGLAAGLAIGAKVTLVGPVLALAVCLAVLTPARSRLSTLLRWTGAAASTGSYWYLRNLFRVGSPIPGVRIGVGAFHLPRPPTPSIDSYTSSLLRNLGSGRLWREALVPGLKASFGSAWPVIMAIVAIALCVGVATLRGRDLVAPLVGLVAIAAFVVTPGTIWAARLIATPGTAGLTAGFFSYDLRYLLPAVAIGLAIVPLVARRWRHGSLLATAALGIALAATQLSAQGRASWSVNHAKVALSVAFVAVAVMIGLTWRRGARATRSALPRRVATWVAVLAVVAIGWPVQHTYQRDRFVGLDLARWADSLPGARIGYSGFTFSYPLYGAHFQNRVRMIGEHGPHGDWHPVPTCAAWRRDVRRADVQYIVVPVGGTQIGIGVDLARWHVGLPGGEPPDEPPESKWSRTDPNVRVVLDSVEGATVYAVTGPATNRGCT